MALPLLASLTAAARFAYPFIARGVREGLSANAIGKALQAQGAGIRRSELLKLVRRETEIWTHGQNLRYLNLTAKPNEANLPEALTTIRRRYSYVVELRGQSMSDGSSVVRNVTVSTDKLLTRGEAEDIASLYAEDGPQQYGLEVSSVLLTSVLKAGAAGTI